MEPGASGRCVLIVVGGGGVGVNDVAGAGIGDDVRDVAADVAAVVVVVGDGDIVVAWFSSALFAYLPQCVFM